MYCHFCHMASLICGQWYIAFLRKSYLTQYKLKRLLWVYVYSRIKSIFFYHSWPSQSVTEVWLFPRKKQKNGFQMVFVTKHDVEKLNLLTKLEVNGTHFQSTSSQLFVFHVRSHYLVWFDINDKPERYMRRSNYPVTEAHKSL